MVYTLFFSRLRVLEAAAREEYLGRADALRKAAEAGAAGFLGIKTYVAEDGERLTVVRFRDAASQRAWKGEAEHREAQRRGRTQYYEWYRVVVCEAMRTHEFDRGSGEAR